MDAISEWPKFMTVINNNVKKSVTRNVVMEIIKDLDLLNDNELKKTLITEYFAADKFKDSHHYKSSEMYDSDFYAMALLKILTSEDQVASHRIELDLWK